MGPLCKCCGKPVPKRMVTHNFGVTRDRSSSPWWRHHPEKPLSRDELQRLVNGEIVSLKMSWRGESPRYIESANVWDGESYVWGGHFHAQGCAATFGQSMAELFPDYTMSAYKAAMAKRKEAAA